MTYIAKPNLPDSEVLNHVARDLIVVKDGNTKLKKALRILTEDGVIHELSFNQVTGLVNLLDTTNGVKAPTPLQYLITHYDLQDLVDLGKDEWLVPEYTIILLAETKTVRFEGRLTRVGYVDKVFTYALGGFDFIQQMSLSRCIAALDPKMEPVIGTYDVTYRFHTGPDGVSISTHGIDDKESVTS